MLVGMVKHLGDEDRDQLTIETMSTEAVTTSAIEGEALDRLGVQVLDEKAAGPCRRQSARAAGKTRNRRDVVDLYRSFTAPLSDEMLSMAQHAGSRSARPHGYRTLPLR